MQKQATRHIWTSGITNVPINDRNSRYTFFELDTKDYDKLHYVLDVYRENLETCYVHELLTGYHFFNFRAIDKEMYGRIIRLLKQLNPLCPLTVLRIIPNKWENEFRYWKKSSIIGTSRELEEFKNNLENQDINAISQKYEIVNYPYEECPQCKLSNNVKWDNALGIFYCQVCNVQTIGRIKPKINSDLPLEEQRIIADRMIRRYNTAW